MNLFKNLKISQKCPKFPETIYMIYKISRNIVQIPQKFSKLSIVQKLPNCPKNAKDFKIGKNFHKIAQNYQEINKILLKIALKRYK